MNAEHSRSKARFWPVALIAALVGVSLVVLWSWPELPRQKRYLASAGVIAGSICAFLLWLLFFSRLRWSTRLCGLAAVLMIGAGLGLTLEIRGVDGDLLPIIEPRWKERARLTAPEQSTEVGANTNEVPKIADFPQFYGPNRNGVISALKLQTNWVANPPEILWRQPVGAAWSGFAVKDGLAITLEQREESEYTIAYDLPSGSVVWTHADGARYSTTIAGEGPRTTPTIAGDRVFTFGATGILNCLDLRTGKVIWRRDTATENDAPVPDWGFASSPLVLNDQVIVSVGGSNGRSMVAYATRDGRELWASGDGAIDYSSPKKATFLGTPQILEFGGNIIGRDLDGKVLWTHPWKSGHPHVSMPLVISSNQFFASSGYGAGCQLVRLERSSEGDWRTEQEWKSIALKSKFGPLFQVGDYIYGLDDGIFCCVDLKTGQRQWKDGRYGHGQGLLVGDLILLTSEKGEIILIRPDPDALVEVARYKLFDEKTWNPPALAGEYLLMRNDKEAACLQLSVKKGLENI